MKDLIEENGKVDENGLFYQQALVQSIMYRYNSNYRGERNFQITEGFVATPEITVLHGYSVRNGNEVEDLHRHRFGIYQKLSKVYVLLRVQANQVNIVMKFA